MVFLLHITLQPPPEKLCGWHRHRLEALEWSRCSDLLCLWYGTWSRNKTTLWGIENFTESWNFRLKVLLWLSELDSWMLLVRNQYSSPHTPLNCLLLLMEAWNEEVYSFGWQGKIRYFPELVISDCCPLVSKNKELPTLKFHPRILASNRQVLEIKKQLLFYRQKRNTSRDKTGVNKEGK